MIRLEDYLYQGDTIFRILHYYANDLEENAFAQQNPIDAVHAGFLHQIYELLEHNEFLTSQSQRMREFYKYMVKEYPYLAFTFKGRIKSLIRAEEKFNRYIVEYTNTYYKKNGCFPSVNDMKKRLGCFRDLIAYRIVICLPRCRVEEKQARKQEEMRLLYEIANELPHSLQEHDFTLVKSNLRNDGKESCKSEQTDTDPKGIGIAEEWQEYYRDYVTDPTPTGYQSIHMTVYDNLSRCYIEVQLRTKDMDDCAEIGAYNHQGYEQFQQDEANARNEVPSGICKYYDEAYERLSSLENLDLSKLEVNMFTALSNTQINDSCGLLRGRQILPFEHLSRFQNEVD
ncbi:MAG: guanosine polyphosphate pyrophosphohydrolase [Lachnospiraceae bacterium]|nr:guanosine polyphosphate pyrophosphohydrolase [Lachnospiraceae bacterium]